MGRDILGKAQPHSARQRLLAVGKESYRIGLLVLLGIIPCRFPVEISSGGIGSVLQKGNDIKCVKTSRL